VAVQILEIRAMPIHEIRGVVASRHFDLDDLRAPVRQLPGGRGPGAGTGEVDDFILGKRFGRWCVAHRCCLSASPVLLTCEAMTSRGNVDAQACSPRLLGFDATILHACTSLLSAPSRPARRD